MTRKVLLLAVFMSTLFIAKSQIVINEINYNPPEAGTDSLEYIELFNAGLSSIDINGYYFSQGITDSIKQSTVIPTGGYFVLAVDSVAFLKVYGFSPDKQWESGGLSNGGETIILSNSTGVTIDSINYDDGAPWPTTPDGSGPSLELCDATLDNSMGGNWKESNTAITGQMINGNQLYGTPGTVNNVTCGSNPPPTSTPLYDIVDIHGEDANGVADSLNVTCSLRGVVTSIDFDGDAGYSFYIQDNTGAINVWNPNDVPLLGTANNYQSTIEDLVLVYGTIVQFRGLTEIRVDSIALASQGVGLPTPSVVSQLDENTESYLVEIRDLQFIDTAQFPTQGSSANVEMVNSSSDTFLVRIDADANITITPQPNVTYCIVGNASQFDPSSPYTEGYQILPRMDSDFTANCTSGINEIVKNNITVYPNPLLIGQDINLNENVNARIFNISGKLVKEVNNTNIISTAEMERGIYILKTDKNQFSKIIIQ